jgi:anaerobic magnesium-protoporphyrin IX monomethyl ester cyclase
VTRRQVDSLYFIDPTFVAPGAGERERVIAISRIARSAGLPFGFETRVDTVDAALMEALVLNGASSVFLGIESGCDRVLRRIGKRVSREQIVRAVRIMQGCDLQLNIGFIMFEPDTTLDELTENYEFLEELGLLNTPELTVNLLYHNQIVLHGSPAWVRFEQEQRLLVDPSLPFEAPYRFKHEPAGRVCAAMGKLAAEYFKGMHGTCSVGCRTDYGDSHVNMLLKEAFRSFVRSAGRVSPGSFTELEERFVQQLCDSMITQATIVPSAVPGNRQSGMPDDMLYAGHERGSCWKGGNT